jgi:hypothetical protein
MEATYKFSAYNAESVYGFGTESEATQFLGCLNEGREINFFEMAVSDLTDEQADTLAVNLRDNLL